MTSFNRNCWNNATVLICLISSAIFEFRTESWSSQRSSSVVLYQFARLVSGQVVVQSDQPLFRGYKLSRVFLPGPENILFLHLLEWFSLLDSRLHETLRVFKHFCELTK